MCEGTREGYLHEINNFIASKSELIEKICEDIGWSFVDSQTSQSSSREEASYVACPLESGHLVAPNKLEDHVSRCRLRQGHYSNEDVPFPQSSDGGGVSMCLSEEDHVAILQRAGKLEFHSATGIEVPLSASRLQSCFTSQQRLALYEHIVQSTSTHCAASSLPLTELDLAFEANETRAEGSKSFLEALAEQRDAKRRRLNYRQAKHVHTKHKSQTEVAREVINNQMELYQQWLEQQTSELSDHSRSTEKTRDVVSNAERHREQEHPHDASHCKSRYREETRESGHNSRHNKDYHSSRDDRDHHRSRSSRVEHTRESRIEHRDSRVEHKREKRSKKRHQSHSSERHRHSKKSKKHKDRDCY